MFLKLNLKLILSTKCTKFTTIVFVEVVDETIQFLICSSFTSIISTSIEFCMIVGTRQGLPRIHCCLLQVYTNYNNFCIWHSLLH